MPAASRAATVVGALAALASSAAAPLAYYVAPTGSDSGPGSPSAPWRTPQRAADAIASLPRPLSAPVEVHLAAGLYVLGSTLRLGPQHGGDAGAQVSWVGDGGGAAVLSGGVPLTEGWQRSSAVPSVFTTSLPQNMSADVAPFVRALYAPAAEGGGWLVRPLATTGVQQYLEVYQTNSSVLLPRDILNASTANASLLHANLVLYHAWATSVNEVAGWNAVTGVLSAVGSLGDPYNPIAGSYNRYELLNMADETRLSPGSYFFTPVAAGSSSSRSRTGSISTGTITTTGTGSGGTIAYKLAAGESSPPSGLLAEGLPAIVELAGANNTAFVNVTFAHAAADLERQCIAGGACCSQSAADLSIGALTVRTGTSNVLLDGLEVAWCGGEGVHVEGGTSGVSITRTAVHDVGAGGIRLGAPPAPGGGTFAFPAGGADPAATMGSSPATADSLIADSVVVDAGLVLPASAGILVQLGTNVSITHCEVTGVANSGVATGWSWGYGPTPNSAISVTANLVHDIGRGEMSDFGCYYNLGVSPGLIVSGNVCHDVLSATYGAHGLYLDEGTSGGTYTNNINYRTKTSGLHVHYGIGNEISNNVFAHSTAFGCVDPTGLGRECDNATAMVDPGDGQANSYIAERNIFLIDAPNGTALLLRTRYPGALNGSWDNNVYWSSAVPDPATAPLFDGGNFSAWQQGSQRDATSAVADPLFANAKGDDYTDLLPSSPALARGFVPINVTGVGPRVPLPANQRSGWAWPPTREEK
jgi:hypothetical protein